MRVMGRYNHMKALWRPPLPAVKVTVCLPEKETLKTLLTATAAGNQAGTMKNRGRGGESPNGRRPSRNKESNVWTPALPSPVKCAEPPSALKSCWSDTPGVTSRKQEVSAGCVESPPRRWQAIFRTATESRTVPSAGTPSWAPSA